MFTVLTNHLANCGNIQVLHKHLPLGPPTTVLLILFTVARLRRTDLVTDGEIKATCRWPIKANTAEKVHSELRNDLL